MAELEPYKGGHYLWKYVPSMPAAIIFLLSFLFATAFHFWKISRTKASFCVAFSIGGICCPPQIQTCSKPRLIKVIVEVIGYAGRATAHHQTGSIMPYAVQNVFLLLGPTLFAASIYMVLGRIIRCVHAETHSLIRINWLTKVFVSGDVFSFLIQGGAAGLMVSGSNAKMGSNIVVVGLLIQVLMFCLFILTSVVFEVRMHQRPTAKSFNAELDWKTQLRTLYILSALILIRSVFRVFEYIEGTDGYLMEHEWTIYIFDAVLMLLVMIVWAIRHPGVLQKFLQQEKAQMRMDHELR